MAPFSTTYAERAQFIASKQRFWGTLLKFGGNSSRSQPTQVTLRLSAPGANGLKIKIT